MKRIGSIILTALLLIAVVPMVLWIAGVFGPFSQSATAFGGADIMLAIAAAYLVVAVAAMIILTAMNFGKGRSSSRAGMYVFGGLALIAVILWFAVAKADPVTLADNSVVDNAFTLKVSDTMLWLAYISLAATFVFLLWGEVRKALK